MVIRDSGISNIESHSKSGRITLIGDAAHPMLPFQAAGGNNALLDAWKLSDGLGKLYKDAETIGSEDIVKVFSAYETEMSKRCAKAVLASRNAAHKFHTTNPFAIAIRNSIMSLVNWKFHVYDRVPAIRWSFGLTALGVVGTSLGMVAKKFLY